VTANQRDKSIERILRQSLAGSDTAVDPAQCVDPETLAAWTDGALRSADAAAVERHVADCHRCQMILATFVRAEPAADVHDAWWQRWHVRWLVPIATAATVAALWMVVPADKARESKDMAFKQSPSVNATAETSQESRREATAQPPAPSLQDAAPPSAAAGRPASRADRTNRDASQNALRKAERFAARDEQRSFDALAPPPPADTQTAPRSLAENAGVAARRPAEEQNRQASLDIVSPSGSERWRIVAETRIERSTTAGASWDAVALPEPVRLTAGHSPGASVAWLVGRGGSIYVTTDGTRFSRVPFTESTDLIAVLAINDNEATVTTADGRLFHTADRGLTWTRR